MTGVEDRGMFSASTKSGLMTALWVGIGVGVIAPLAAMAFNTIRGKTGV